MKHLKEYIQVCALGGILFYVSHALERDVFRLESLLKCAGLAIIGGVIPAMIVGSLGKKHIPLINSWTALVILIYGMNFIIHSLSIWKVSVFGYITYLLWEGYHGRLNKF